MTSALEQLKAEAAARAKPPARHGDIDKAERVFVLLDHSYWQRPSGLWMPLSKADAHDLMRPCKEDGRLRAEWKVNSLYLWPPERDEDF